MSYVKHISKTIEFRIIFKQKLSINRVEEKIMLLSIIYPLKENLKANAL